MRSDRKRKQQQYEQKMKKNRFSRAISIIYTLLAACFVGLLLWLNVLPAKYLYPLIGVLAVITLLIVPIMYSKNGKKTRKRITTVFAILMIIVFGVGSYYMGATMGFFNEITKSEGSREDFYLVVKADSQYEKAEDLSGKTIGTHATADKNYTEAKNELKSELSAKYEYVEEIPDFLNGLLENKQPAIFISAATYSSMKEVDSTLEEDTKIIHTISIKVNASATKKHVDVTKESFNVFISGLDTTGDIGTVSRSDVNMIVTVNPNTKEILITSVPRDYYVNLPSKGAKDKLTHSGLYGIEETVGAIEDLMGIEINYYAKVNYSTITKLVDAIGGIDIDSPYGFSTHGMTEKYTFSKGQNHLNGSMALAYSRERKSWSDGDMRRNENQQLIMEAIMNKCLRSSTILGDYTSILNAIKTNLETDMSRKDMTSLIKMQLKSMPSWTIEKQALKGKPGYDMCYALGFSASIVLHDEVLMAEAADRITQVKEAKEE